MWCSDIENLENFSANIFFFYESTFFEDFLHIFSKNKFCNPFTQIGNPFPQINNNY